jgi:hypothetical protein
METKGIEIKLSHDKSEEFFYNALCNALGCMGGYGLEFEYDAEEYKKSKQKLSKGVCFEDVLMQMLKDGFKLTLIDIECEGEYTSTIGMEEVHERVQKAPLEHLKDMINENDDADTGDVILQTVFFNDIIFG